MLCKKALTHENLSSALQITFHFMKRNIFHVLELTLKIAFSNFLSLRKNFSASVALHSLHLLSCTKHSISVLSSNSISVLALKKALTWKSVFCIANNISFHEKETSFMYLSLLLKLHLATFSHWEEAFQHPWPCIPSFA